MAYTKIIPIRSRLDICLNYIRNPEKTDLQNALDHIENSDKNGTLQSAFHCQLDTAFQDMKAVKRRWGKDTGKHVQGYHIIQSFRPGEVTPEQAHALGREFVTRYLKNEYQAVVTTHMDKAHLHCHIVFNSVNLLNGRMYRNTFADYFDGIRGTSDALCRENDLSVIKPEGHSRSRAEYEAVRRGEPTLRDLIRRDIDAVIDRARDWNDFLHRLSQQGYAVKTAPHVRHTAIRRPDAKRFIRLRSLGERYTEAAIRQRIIDRYTYGTQSPLPLPKPPCHRRYRGKLHERKKYTGFIALYYRYVYLLRGAQKNRGAPRVSRLLMDDVIRLNKFVAQHKVITKYRLVTADDLCACRLLIASQIKLLTDKRKENLHEPQAQTALSEITAGLRALRRDLRLLKNLEQDAPHVQERLRQIDEQEARIRKEREDYERSERSRRAARPRGLAGR